MPRFSATAESPEMMSIRLQVGLVLFGFLALAFRLQAAPPEHPLPPDVLARFSVPDLARWRGPQTNMAPLRLWHAASMGTFRARFIAESNRRFLGPLNQATGVDWAEVLRLAEGRLTWAWLPETPATNEFSRQVSAHLLLFDLGSNTNAFDRLVESLPTSTNSATSSKAAFATSVVRGVTFRSRRLDPARWQAVFDAAFPPPPDEGKSTKGIRDAPTRLHLGRIDAVGIATTWRSDLDLASLVDRFRQPPLPPSSGTRGATGELLVEGSVERRGLARLMHLPDEPLAADLTSLPPVDRLKVALGLAGLQRARCSVETLTNGWILNLGLEIPEPQRRGLFSLAKLLPYEVAPPAFIPSNVRQFSRVRLASIQAWSQLERMLGDIDPSVLGVFQLFTGYAGRTEDADFDFMERVVGLLGDDWILASGPTSAAATVSDPSETGLPGGLLLIGSSRAAELAAGLRSVASPGFLATFFPPDSAEPTRLQAAIQGQAVTTVVLPAIPWLDGRTGLLQVAASQGYCGLGTERRWMERFLGTNTVAGLAARDDFQRALAMAGGSQTGLLLYHDEAAAAGSFFAAARGGPAFLESLLRWVTFSDTAIRLLSGVSGWLDFTVLPPFESVSTHFGPCVQCGRADAAGFSLRAVRLETPQP
jgi:hypothetical protein